MVRGLERWASGKCLPHKRVSDPCTHIKEMGVYCSNPIVLGEEAGGAPGSVRDPVSKKEVTSDLQTHVCTHAHAYVCTPDTVVSVELRVQGTEQLPQQVPWEFPKARPLGSLRILYGPLTPFQSRGPVPRGVVESQGRTCHKPGLSEGLPGHRCGRVECVHFEML